MAVSALGFILLFVALVFLRTQTEIRTRRARALLAREQST
jgi:heme exporter protein C